MIWVRIHRTRHTAPTSCESSGPELCLPMISLVIVVAIAIAIVIALARPSTRPLSFQLTRPTHPLLIPCIARQLILNSSRLLDNHTDHYNICIQHGIDNTSAGHNDETGESTG
jgi:hypothetical protein